MRPLRLLFIEPCPRDFGGYFRANALARVLAKAGCQVKLVVPARAWGALRSHSVPTEGVHLVEHAEIPRWPLGKLARIPLVAAEILASKADLVHVFGSVHPENLVGLLVARGFGRKVVVDWDDLWQDGPSFFDSGKAVRAYLRLAEDRGVRLGAGVTVASSFLEERARTLGVAAVSFVPNGLWREQFEPVPRARARQELGIAPGALVALAFGNTYLQGRGRMLIETFAELLTAKPDAVALTNLAPVVIWGTEGAGQALPPGSERVRCVGQIPQTRLGLYLGAADFVVFLSTGRPAERAAFPIRLSSYLNGECPIVTNQAETEAGCLVRRFGCGLIVTDPADAARAMIEAHRDPSAYQRMVEGTRAAKGALDYDTIGRNLLGFYEGILAG